MSARAKRRPARARHIAEARVDDADLPRRILLDTHVWLWWQTDDSRLGPRARRVIAAAAEVRLSAASVWEMAIKSALGKLTLPKDADIAEELRTDGFLPLPVEIAHADRVRFLPPLHRDPFDRMLVAQAQVEGLTIVSVDAPLEAYDVGVFPATE